MGARAEICFFVVEQVRGSFEFFRLSRALYFLPVLALSQQTLESAGHRAWRWGYGNE